MRTPLVLEQRLEPRGPGGGRPAGVEGFARDLDEAGASLAVAQLHDAQPVAQGLEAHRLGVDGEVGRAEVGVEQLLRQVPLQDLGVDVGRGRAWAILSQAGAFSRLGLRARRRESWAAAAFRSGRPRAEGAWSRARRRGEPPSGPPGRAARTRARPRRAGGGEPTPAGNCAARFCRSSGSVARS